MRNDTDMKTLYSICIIMGALLGFAVHLQGYEKPGQSIKANLIPQEKEMDAYLMVFHKDETHGLYMAVSYDGYTFTALNDGDPVIAGDTIASQRGIRDPHIFRGPDGAFYLVMTDLHIYARREGYRDTE